MSIEDFLTFLADQKLNYVELKCDWRACAPEYLNSYMIKELDELLQSFSMHPSIHACYIDLNLASLSKTIRKASIKITSKNS